MRFLGIPSVSQSSVKGENDNSTFTCEASFGGPARSEIGKNHYPEMTMYLGSTALPGTTIEKEPEAPSNIYTFTQVISKTENNDTCHSVYV